MAIFSKDVPTHDPPRSQSNEPDRLIDRLLKTRHMLKAQAMPQHGSITARIMLCGIEQMSVTSVAVPKIKWSVSVQAKPRVIVLLAQDCIGAYFAGWALLFL